ncbi:unnamed protein product [Cuscuta epithymum]|uniref:D-isomer specific 2-hydroxyacid dehydrogenase NAD-binding domain-containing protein n=1 Tax=Cuscuta epithymum TaxID=186058 RepID=A0AAV0C1L2_9ASTE|nr:unnamed protein product [Cuscuta epithymum]
MYQYSNTDRKLSIKLIIRIINTNIIMRIYELVWFVEPSKKPVSHWQSITPLGLLLLLHPLLSPPIFLLFQFSGKSVGIIGLGRIGSAIAKRAEAFGCRISYTSRLKKPHINYTFHSSVVGLAADSQILIVACSLTEETRHIVDRKVIDALGPNGVLINIGRGAHVDEPELVSALLEGRLGGAGLDVYENEPDVPDVLFGLRNVVLLPHVASDTVETSRSMADLVVANLEAHFLNKPLLSPVI